MQALEYVLHLPRELLQLYSNFFDHFCNSFLLFCYLESSDKM